MLGIVICDDDPFTLELAAKTIQDCIVYNRLDANIVCMTRSTKDMIAFLQRKRGIYLIFLDLDFGRNELNGVDVAKIVKEIEPLSKIVFVTSHANMSIHILKSGAEAFGFMEKTADISKMLAGYQKYISLASELISHFQHSVEAYQQNVDTKHSIRLPVGTDEFLSIPIPQILYVESAKTMAHFVCYHTINGSSVSVRDTIENVLTVLGDGFMKSHRSVIINKSYVMSVSDGLVRFINGETAACALRMKSEIIKLCKADKSR